MLVDEAIALLKTVYSNYRIASYKDLGDLYVFEAYSPEFDLIEGSKTAMDPWYYVNKNTRKIGHYYPFSFNPKKFFETESNVL